MKTVLIHRSSLEIDQIPPGVREAIHQFFTGHAWPADKCDRMLECLLPYAQVKKPATQSNDQEAKIVIPNLLKIYRTYRNMQTTCCYQTLHTFVRLLCSLDILKKQRSFKQPTTYLLSLDPEYCFQNSPAILAAVDRLCDPLQTKNAKMRKKARDVKFRLLCMNPMAQSKMSANLTAFPVALQQSMLERISNLVDSLQLSPSTTAILAKKITEVCANVLHQESTMVVSACVEITSSVDSSPVLSAQESTRTPYPVDSHTSMPITESTRTPYPVDSLSRLPERRWASFEHEKQRESTNKDKNLPNDAPSSIDSVFIQKDSLQKEFELESPVDEPWIGSEEELSQEAARYLTLLDGPEYATPEYLNTHTGKKSLGGYRNKIRRSPHLARISAINTLLQKTFYDLTKQKKPLENAGKWFHSSFDRYADPVRPMEITGEILDWAKSPYTLEEIALVIPLERQRQEAQWWPPEPLHYPFASCVARYHQVPDTVSELQGNLPEENRDGSSLAGTQIKTEGLLRLSALQGMSASEAEHVATEIRQEASWYLYDILVRASHEGENAFMVEAYLVDSVFLVTYRTRQEWWLHHQEQLRGEVYAAYP